MILVFPDVDAVADYVSDTLYTQIRSRPPMTLGLATGGTMEPIYQYFIDKVKAGNLDVSQLSIFNLDEYVGLDANHPQSYAAYMKARLFEHLPFNLQNCHVPDGKAALDANYCQQYSTQIQRHGGIDFQLLGVGGNGHIGFNEPGTPFDSRCHIVELAPRTRLDNSRFFAPGELVPAHAITMGIQDIMEAREILLVATGPKKASTMKKFVDHGITEQVPFTVLKRHPATTIVLDEAAAQALPPASYQRIYT